MSAAIRLRFVDSDDWVSRVIKMAQLGFGYQHVEAVMPDGSYLGAHMSGGVQARAPDYDQGTFVQELFVDIPCTQGQADVFHAFLLAQVGKPYDVAAIEYMAEGFVDGDAPAPAATNGFICSALQLAGVMQVGLAQGTASASPRLATPRDVLQAALAWTKRPVPHLVKKATPMFKLGRKRPTMRAKLKIGNYLIHDELPEPPIVAHWTRNAPALYNVLANDTLGCCTSSGAGHILDALRVNAGNGGRMVTEADAIAFYSKSTGYNPADPSTDQGGDEIAVLNTWRDKGYFPDGSGKITAYTTVNGANVREVKAAIWLFENVYFGVELPDAWTQNEPSENGFIWDVAGDANPASGHCFCGLGYNTVGVIIDTWGLIGTMTWAAVAKYATAPLHGELYTVFSEEEIAKASTKAPSGFDDAQLLTDIKAIS